MTEVSPPPAGKAPVEKKVLRPVEAIKSTSKAIAQKGMDVAQTVREFPKLFADLKRAKKITEEARQFDNQFDAATQLGFDGAQKKLFTSYFALELLKHTPGELQHKTTDEDGEEVYDMNEVNDRGQQEVLKEIVGQTHTVLASEMAQGVSEEVAKKSVRVARGSAKELARLYLLRLHENIQDKDFREAIGQIRQRLGVYDVQQNVSDIGQSHADTEIPLRAPDHALDELKNKKYTRESPRTSFTYAGERPVIRSLDPQDRDDMHRMQVLVRDVQNKDFFAKFPDSDSDILGYKPLGQDDKWPVFVIAGNEGVAGKEKGELQGVVHVYEVGPDDMQERAHDRQLIHPQEGQSVLEVAYAKLPDAAPGQVASGARQVLQRVLQLDMLQKASAQADREFGIATVDRNKVREEMGIADADEELTPEQQVEFDARVQQLREQSVLSSEQRAAYDARVSEIIAKEDFPKPIITATISPRNEESMRVMEATGFVLTRTPSGEPGMVTGMSDEQDYLYVLDWDRLQQKVHERADNALFPKTMAQAASQRTGQAA